MQPDPFVRGNPFPPVRGVAYPRAKGDDAVRLPVDTWTVASIPVGVRLEIVGDAEAVDVEYRTAQESLGYRGAAAGDRFTVWRDGRKIDEQKASFGESRVRLRLGSGEARAIVYLPEGMKPAITGIEPVGGAIEPAPSQPRWIAYGDSIVEGWCASGPAMSWPAIVAREHGLDVANMGYAGAARGEIVSAEHIAELSADIISISHGTNCWTRIPHSVDQFRANLHAFLDVVRQGHPETPIVVISPVVRPDAESTPNRLGATLADLRAAMEEVTRARIATGDERLRLVEGRPILEATLLDDGIHPNDDGHRAIADALAPVLRAMIDGSR